LPLHEAAQILIISQLHVLLCGRNLVSFEDFVLEYRFEQFLFLC